jgi:hypothetical protein
VDGAIITRHRLETDFRVSVGGPMVAEESIRLGSGNIVGQQHRPTSLAAPTVELGIGTLVHGLITAPQGGTTSPIPE